MDTALLNGGFVSVYELGDYSEIINVNYYEWLRLASQESQLTCPECGNRVILRVGTIKRPHFAHKTKPDSCQYEIYYREFSKSFYLGKKQLYMWLKNVLKNNELLEVDKRFCDSLARVSFYIPQQRIAVDYITTNLRVMNQKIKNQYMDNNEIDYIPIFSYESFHRTNTTEYDLKLLEKYSKEKVLIRYSTEEEIFYLSKSMRYTHNDNIVNERIFEKSYALYELKFDATGISLVSFDSEYNEAYLKFIERNRELFAKVDAVDEKKKKRKKKKKDRFKKKELHPKLSI